MNKPSRTPLNRRVLAALLIAGGGLPILARTIPAPDLPAMLLAAEAFAATTTAAPPRIDDEFVTLTQEFQKAQEDWYHKYQEESKRAAAEIKTRKKGAHADTSANPKPAEAAKPDTGDEADDDADEQFVQVDMSKLPPRPEDAFKPKFKAYAEKHAGTSDAIPALIWLATNSQPKFENGRMATDAAAKDALARLTKDHAADDSLADKLDRLRYAVYSVGRDPLMSFFEQIAKVNKDKDAQAAAKFGLACLLYEGDPFSRMSGLDQNDNVDAGESKTAENTAGAPKPADTKSAEKTAAETKTAQNKSTESKAANARDAESKRGLDLFREVKNNYADTRFAKNAAGYIFEVEHLQIGMHAPDIVGQNADGKEIRLSQFAGQVVVLDFWGFW